MRRSLPESNTTWLRSSSAAVDAADRGQCVWTLWGAGHCAHLLIPFGFGVTLMWICVLWIAVRLLRRRRSVVVADVAVSSSLCVCRSLGRRDVLAWTASARQPCTLSGTGRYSDTHYSDSHCSDNRYSDKVRVDRGLIIHSAKASRDQTPLQKEHFPPCGGL